MNHSRIQRMVILSRHFPSIAFSVGCPGACEATITFAVAIDVTALHGRPYVRKRHWPADCSQKVKKKSPPQLGICWVFHVPPTFEQSRYLEGALFPWPVALCHFILQSIHLHALMKYVSGAFAAIFAQFCYSGWSVHASTIHVPGPGTFPSSPSRSHLPRTKPCGCIFRVLDGIFLILDVCMLCSMPARSQNAMVAKACARSCGPCDRTVDMLW